MQSVSKSHHDALVRRPSEEKNTERQVSGVLAMQRTQSEKAFLKIEELIDSGIEPSVAIECVKSDLKRIFSNDADYIDTVEWIIKQLQRRQTGEGFDDSDF